MNMTYLLYEVERGKTAREQREAYVRAGELAADFARLRRTLRRALRRTLRRGTATHTDAAVVCDAAVAELELAGPGARAGDHTGHLTSRCG